MLNGDKRALARGISWLGGGGLGGGVIEEKGEEIRKKWQSGEGKKKSNIQRPLLMAMVFLFTCNCKFQCAPVCAGLAVSVSLTVLQGQRQPLTLL